MDKFEKMVSLISLTSSSPVVAYQEKPININDNVVVWKIISTMPVKNHNKTDSSERNRIRLFIYSDSQAKNFTLADNIKNAIDFNSSDFKSSFLDNGSTFKDIELLPNGYSYILDFIIW